MTNEANRGWSEEDDRDFIAARALVDDPNFLRWCARLEREQREKLSAAGEDADKMPHQEMTVRLAVYNTIERIPGKMRKWVELVAKGKALQGAAQNPAD